MQTTIESRVSQYIQEVSERLQDSIYGFLVSTEISRSNK